MTAWRPIEDIVSDNPVWVLKYDVFFYPKEHELYGNFCSADTSGAQKFTSCHGWYRTEAEALKAQHHFQKPDSYRLEKVYQRKLKEDPKS